MLLGLIVRPSVMDCWSLEPTEKQINKFRMLLNYANDMIALQVENAQQLKERWKKGVWTKKIVKLHKHQRTKMFLNLEDCEKIISGFSFFSPFFERRPSPFLDDVLLDGDLLFRWWHTNIYHHENASTWTNTLIHAKSKCNRNATNFSSLLNFVAKSLFMSLQVPSWQWWFHHQLTSFVTIHSFVESSQVIDSHFQLRSLREKKWKKKKKRWKIVKISSCALTLVKIVKIIHQHQCTWTSHHLMMVHERKKKVSLQYTQHLFSDGTDCVGEIDVKEKEVF